MFLSPTFAYVVALTTLACCGLIALTLIAAIRGLDV
jgi:hypothetical protein